MRKHVTPLLISLALVATIFANARQTKYNVGDKVEAKDNVNLWLPAEIIDIKDGQYKVHFIGYGDYYDLWLGPDRIRKAQTKKDDKASSKNKIPPINGAVPKIKGTAWWLQAIYKKGTTPKNYHSWPPFIFCNNGRWEMQSSYVQSGTYTIAGNKLSTIGAGADKLKEVYTITWNAKEMYMELTAKDNTVMRLVYNTVSDCGKNDK